MKLETVKQCVGDLPWMNDRKAARMWNFLTTQRLARGLELGFFHGVSSVYIAAALDEMGEGHLTTIDLLRAGDLEPNIDQLLGRLGLTDRVTALLEPISYTWRLMKMLEQTFPPQFDFCYIDGDHGWDNTGFAFFLVERLLRPGGWVIFDDLTWTYGTSATLAGTERVRRMSDEQRDTPQVGKVFDLLVRTHPHFTNFRTERDWGFAQKKECKSR